jgi:hypothetical protein
VTTPAAERSICAKRGNLKIRLLFAGAAVAVDVLPRCFYSAFIVGHQMQFIFDIGVMVRLEQLAPSARTEKRFT